MNYRQEVLRTLGTAEPRDTVMNGAMGLCGEAGEVIELVKKHVFHGAPLDTEKLIKELGDVRWYLEVLAYAAGTTMEEIEARNVAKLRARYPDGFSAAASKERKDTVNE